jgi:hypothetical protein
MPSPSHSLNIGTEMKLQSIVDDWRTEENGLTRFGYHMEHKYTPSSFGAAFLKGRDEIVFQTLMNAKNAVGTALFEVSLVLMERYIEKEVEYDGCDDTDIIRASKVLDRNGVDIDKTGWEMFQVKGGWMVPEHAFYECLTDEEDEEGEEDDNGNRFSNEHAMFDHENGADKVIRGPYTGNEGAKKEFWYYAAAVVVSLQKP